MRGYQLCSIESPWVTPGESGAAACVADLLAECDPCWSCQGIRRRIREDLASVTAKRPTWLEPYSRAMPSVLP